MTMTYKAATAAIEAILSAVPDEELPKPTEVDRRDGRTTLWFGGDGRILGTAKTNGVRNPAHYRSGGAYDALLGEAVFRADQRYLDAGDKG